MVIHNNFKQDERPKRWQLSVDDGLAVTVFCFAPAEFGVLI